MADANLLSTPENYATPEQLRAMEAYSQALLKDSQKPIRHWTQGLSNIVSALVGGNQSWLANQKQNESNAVRAGRLMPDTSGQAAPTEPPLAPRKVVEGTAPTSGGGPIDIGRASKATAAIESGGDYGKLGPIINKGAYAGDRAYGKYQVMGKNIPEWTKAILGRSMTPEEFKNDPKAQDAVYQAKMTEYATKHGPEGAARAWFAGEGGMNDMGRKDQLGTTVANYGKRFAQAYGPDAGSTPPAVQAVTDALRGTQTAQADVAAKGGPPPLMGAPRQQRPDPEGSKIYINPALVPKRPQMNPGQVRGMLSDPSISEAARMQLRQEYMQRNQPIEVPVTGGRVLINPLNPMQQQFIPEAKWGKNKIGDMETDVQYTGDGRGNVIQSPTIVPGAAGPRSEAVPGAVAPAAAPQGGPAAPASPGAAVASAAPAAPVAAPVAAPEAVPNTGGVQVASLDPSAGVAQAAEATPAADNPLAKWAQATPPGAPALAAADPILEKLKLNNFPQKLIDDYVAKKEFDDAHTLKLKKGESDIGVDAEMQKKNNDASLKRYEDTIKAVAPATAQRENLSQAKIASQDPKFYAGTGSELVEAWKKVKDAMGIEPGAAAPMEIFKKTTAQSIMSGLKTAFEGLGQIRVAEILLQQTANASTANTPTAIKALLEITDRNAAKIQDIGGMLAAYKAGDAVVDPKNPDKVLIPANRLGPDGVPLERAGFDARFERTLQAWQKANPTFTPEEVKAFMADLKAKPGEASLPDAVAPAGAPAPPISGAPAIGTKQMFDDGKGGKVEGVWDGKAWGPVK